MFVTHHIALLQCSFFLCGLTSSISACCNGLVVTVDGSSSDVVRDCSKVSGSLANLTCSSLQDVLLSVSENITLSGGGSEDLISCVEVRLLPGHYALTQTITVVGQNLKLLGDQKGGIIVSFNFSDRFDPTVTNSPFYVLSLQDTNMVEIRGISFQESPGIITTVNVDSVLVEDCSFRCA